MPSEIMIPFQIGEDGRVAAVLDPDVQARQHVRALLNTNPAERVMLPGYGVHMESVLFEPGYEEEITTTVGGLVSDALAAWEPGIGLSKVKTTLAKGLDGKPFVDVRYFRKDAPDSGEIANLNQAIIGANGVIRNIVRG